MNLNLRQSESIQRVQNITARGGEYPEVRWSMEEGFSRIVVEDDRDDRHALLELVQEHVHR